MESGADEITVRNTDPEINAVLTTASDAEADYSAHFNQSEEFFLLLSRTFTVPPIPIHHDVRVEMPSSRYREILRHVVTQLLSIAPDLFKGMTYFFEPGDVLRPAFFQLFKVDDLRYLYLLRVDLTFRATEAELLMRGSNDLTAEYRTDRLFAEAILIPIESVKESGGAVSALIVSQSISDTWIGETGNGYFVQGIWMDRELTKFFTRLFVPQGVRFYPYYPFICKYRTVCHLVAHPSLEGRRRHAPILHKAYRFLLPEMRRIEAALRSAEFSEELDVFKALKARVPDYWRDLFSSLTVKAYLNAHERKEFLVEA